MGIALPQLAPASEDRSSGALAVDGSLKFNKASKLHLLRTPGSSGNQKTWTLSFWFKKQNMGDQRVLFNSFTDNSNRVIIRFMSDKLQFALQASGTFYGLQTNQVFRDNGWYHVVMVLDTTQNNETSRQRIYVNGDKIADGDLANNSISGSNKYPTKDATFNTNTTVAHYIGANNESSAVQDTTFDGQISNAYLIDGLAIAPAFFGYTDPLTNVWRPRGKLKKTVNDGTNFTADITNTGSTLNNPGRIFDGTIDSDATIASGAATITYTPSTPIKYTDSVRVMGSGSPSNPYNARWQLNGGSNVSTVNANEFVTLDEGNGGGTITSIKLTVDSGGANWRAIQVDGVIMKASSVTSIEFGTNGYYLPFDGSAPIGQDQSGQGNNWTPVNFGGSATLDKATGAKPILNTVNGGNNARAGVFGGDVSATYTTTSASNSGGKYVFENEGTQPTFSFIRGATYTFDWSASSGHPLRFATAADAAGSTEYTNGTNVTGNVTKITVPHNAPDTLYYYCNVHNGMGNSISVTTDETKADPYAWKNVLALPLVGTDDDGRSDLSNSINCTSTAKTTSTNNTVGSNAQSNFYGGSFYFDGTEDYLQCGNSSDYNMDGDFTAEAWVYPTSHANDYAGIFGFSYDSEGQGWNLLVRSSSGRLHINVDMNYTDVTNSLQLNKWTHVALVRSGTGSGNCKLYIDGVADPTTITDSDTTGTPSGAQCLIGSYPGYANSREFTGYIQDARIYKGVAKYTSNFIPAATNPDILPDSPSGVAAKSKLKKVTDGAVSFDGTGDEVNVPGHSDLAFGTGNFTIDCFAYFNSFDDNYPTVLSKLVDSTLSWIVRVKNNGKVVWYSKNGGGTNNESSSEPIVLRKWHHIAVVREGTGTDQLKVYVDGTVAITMTDSNDYNDNSPLCIGTQQAGGGNTINGFISNVRIVKGTALYTGNFAPPGKKLANVTNTKLLCCQSPTSATTADVIPTGSITAAGNAAATNFNPFNTDISTVRGQESNYATLNPLANAKFQSKTLKDGNLELSGNMSGGSGYPTAFSNFTMNGSGKFYMEATPFNTTDTSGVYIGLCDNQMAGGGVSQANTYPGGPGGVAYAANGTIADNNSNTFTSQPTYTAGDVISVAYDADNGKVYFAKNGNYIAGANPVTGANPHDTGRTGDQFFVVGGYENRNVSVNFGQKPFSFPPPDGYQPLTSSTLRPDAIITRPDKFCGATLYTGSGDGVSPRAIELPHSADLVWVKSRDRSSNHQIADTVRGNNSILASNNNQSARNPTTQYTGGGLSTIDGKTITLASGTSDNRNLNTVDEKAVVWSWKAGGAPTATNNNTSGAMDANSVSIDGVLQSAYTPSGSPSIYPKKMSIGTKQGFSIIQWTDQNNAQTLPHGLSQAPDFILIKDMGASVNWSVYHSSMGNAKAMYLNTADDEFTTSRWNSTSPTASVFSWNDNTSTNDQIAYCWHNVPGLQKFGHYIGSGSDDGTFVELGFRPAIVWVKCNDSDFQEWVVWDNKRSPYNLVDKAIYHHSNATESDNGSSRKVDFLSNGFKLRNGGSGATGIAGRGYLYMAWAEAPAFNLYGAMSSAR